MNSSLAPVGPVDVLVVAAHPPDLVGLRNALSERLAGYVRNLHVVAKTVGVGMPAAAAGAANRLQQLQPRCVVVLGTCGVYPGLAQYRPMDVVIATRAHLCDPAVLLGKSAFPDPMQTTLDLHPLLAAGLGAAGPRVRQAPVAVPLASLVDDALAQSMAAQVQCEAENLELFGIALACHAAQVPCAAALGVTHVVGSRAREDWRQYHRQAVTAAADVVTAWIATGAQGLPHGR